MKKVLGLDIGTNSIGWAFIETNVYEEPDELKGRILDLGSRIIPMDGDALNKFETGNPESKAAARRQARGARRLNQRYKLRRTRLIRALKILGWIPDNFPNDFKNLTTHSINTYLPYTENLKKEAAQFFGIEGRKTIKEKDYLLPDDWIIYFLKTKALKDKISLPELARILYHYNQRRGFKSSRKENKLQIENTEIKYPYYEKWIEFVTITSITEKGKEKDYTVYELNCKTQNFEFITEKKRKNPLNWLNKNIEVEITRKTTKDQTIQYYISEVDPKAWENRKSALEKEIKRTGMYISEYYLTNLKNDRNFQIKQRIVDRSFYQEEFKQIWETQSRFYKNEFENKECINQIADTFYIHNKEKNKEIKAKDLFHIFFNDIIYYQRGLKSQKGLLAKCQYEKKVFKEKNGEKKSVGVSVTSKSSPAFQEFRIWQTIHNLKVIKKEGLVNGRVKLDIDVTKEYLTQQNKEKLFELFDGVAEVSHDSILRQLGFQKIQKGRSEKEFEYRLNYPEEKDFPGNETKTLFRRIFKKFNYELEGEKYLNNPNLLNHLWHIVYSLPEEFEIKNALNNNKYFNLPEEIINHISKLPEFKAQYASLSTKAINKLLPLMRVGKYWDQNFEPKINERINKIIDGEFDEGISDKAREEVLALNLNSINDFSGLPTYIAAYIVYGRHSERENELKYDNPEDLKIKELIPYNSMRNPVVEKVIRETLSLVKDIWQDTTLGRPDFIHVELGREMKNNNEDRRKLTENNTKNRIEKERAIALLKELKYKNFNANSLNDLEKFRIWKENGGKIGDDKFEELFKSNKSEFIKDADIEKYRHWAEQNYRSPYSGNPIPLSELFTEKFQVDHIIPRSRFYDDSASNKVVVESELNDAKGNKLAIQFIEDSQGKGLGVQSLEEYLKFVDEVFANKKKKRNLKLYEIPEDFVTRQLNDTKYISRTVAQLLRPIAIGTETDEGIVYSSGSITSTLKDKWGLHSLWKKILKPRFERLEEILGEKLIFESEKHRGDFRFGKDYKRIDHRHHALDALVVACTSRSHIKYLNSLNSLSNNKADIIKYNEWTKWKYLLNKSKQIENKVNGMTEFSVPWDGFFEDAKNALESIIVSHKPSSKLISKTINKYYKWKEVEPGKWEKTIHLQDPPMDPDKYWVAVRQSLFGQPLGRIFLPEYKKGVNLKGVIKAQIKFKTSPQKTWNSEEWRVAKKSTRKEIDKVIHSYNGDENTILKHFEKHPLLDEKGGKIETLDLLRFKKYASKRVSIDESFNEDKIKNMPFSELESNWLTKLLKKHLADSKNDPKIAFKGEGLELLSQKAPFPISKVTRKESGEKIDLNNKLLDGDKGVNQYFVVEIKTEVDKKTGVEKPIREYTTPKFLECIERLGKGLPIHDDNPGSKYIILSPGDLVYVPRKGEKVSEIDWNNKKQIAERTYIMKSSTETKCYFLPASVSSLIIPYDAKTKKGEFEALNKSEKTFDKSQTIKENFIKIKVSRHGKVTPVL